MRGSLLERLMAKMEVSPSGCWIFTGSLKPNGYGEIALGSREQGNGYAHIVAFELFIGPVPPGHDVGHICHDDDDECAGGLGCPHRRCFRPSHLEAQTRSQNAFAGRTGEAPGSETGRSYGNGGPRARGARGRARARA